MSASSFYRPTNHTRTSLFSFSRWLPPTLLFLSLWEIGKTFQECASLRRSCKALATLIRLAPKISPFRRTTSHRLWLGRSSDTTNSWWCSRMTNEWELEGTRNRLMAAWALNGSCKPTWLQIFRRLAKPCISFLCQSPTNACLRLETWQRKLLVEATRNWVSDSF